MILSLSLGPNLVLPPFPSPTTAITDPFFRNNRIHFGSLSYHKPILHGTLAVARFGLGQPPDPDTAQLLIKDLFGRAEGFLYTVADAAVSASPPPDSVTSSKQSSDWLSGITNYMEAVLKVLKDGLSTLHAPYAYGFAIILLTVLVKAATFPLTKKQVESAMAMRSLQPQIKAIQQRYTGDQEKIQVETARLYKLAGINPLAGCLPTLATIPVWIGLYRALSNVADEGLLSEGFFWIPSLAGPTTIAARQNGSGISWLFPFIDGQPPLGWSDTLAYLVLPVLLVVSQYISVQIMQSSQSDDPNLKSSQAITKFLPLLIGYFALSVPSGLSLYWLTNNILSTAQQVWLQKLGGANNPVSQLSNDSITKEPTKIQKSKVEKSTIKMTPIGGEKRTPEGARPGDRFKQLKEQEARRRQQREEEKREAIEAAGNDLQITNGELEKEAYLVEREDTKVELRNTNDVSTTGNSSNGEYNAVNGNYSPSESKEDQKISIHRMEDGEISSHSNNGRDHQHLYENVEKEEAVATLGRGENKLSGEDNKIRTEAVPMDATTSETETETIQYHNIPDQSITVLVTSSPPPFQRQLRHCFGDATPGEFPLSANPSIVLHVLTSCNLDPQDLAKLEATSSFFRQPAGFAPGHELSLAELAALDMCHNRAIFKPMTGEERLELKRKCGGSWKLVLRFFLDGEAGSRREKSQAIAGHGHSIAVTSKGVVYSFGSNNSGQLGHGTIEEDWRPHQIRSLQGIHIIKAAAGARRTILISDAGQVYAFERNVFGEAEYGVQGSKLVNTPQLVESLKHIFMVQAAIGNFFTAVLSR